MPLILLTIVTTSRKAILKVRNLRGIRANGSNGALVSASKTKVRSQGGNLLICTGDSLSLTDKNLLNQKVQSQSPVQKTGQSCNLNPKCLGRQPLIRAILGKVQDGRDLSLGSPLRLAPAWEDYPDFCANTPGNRLLT